MLHAAFFVARGAFSRRLEQAPGSVLRLSPRPAEQSPDPVPGMLSSGSPKSRPDPTPDKTIPVSEVVPDAVAVAGEAYDPPALGKSGALVRVRIVVLGKGVVEEGASLHPLLRPVGGEGGSGGKGGVVGGSVRGGPGVSGPPVGEAIGFVTSPVPLGALGGVGSLGVCSLAALECVRKTQADPSQRKVGRGIPVGLKNPRSTAVRVAMVFVTHV